jgi:tetratricopeptide (TPR) repeat protein
MLLVAVVALATFLPGLRGEFVLDDHRFIEENEAVTSQASALRILVDPRTVAEDSWEGIFRPLRTMSFAMDHALWGLHPFGYHVQSLLWHALASVMLLALLVRLGLGKAPSTIAALIFAAHPVQAESVVWITSRGDVLSGALVLVALYLHAGWDDQKPWRGMLVAVVCLLALLAKEVAIVVPALVVLLDVALLKPWNRPGSVSRPARRRMLAHALRAWAPIMAVAVLYFVFRQWRTSLYSEDLEFGQLIHWWGGAYSTQICVAARGLILHVAALLLPIGPRFDYYPPADGRIDTGVLLAVLALAGILVLAVRCWRSRPLVSVGLLWFLLALAPVSNILFAITIPAADRFLYIPLAGGTMALATLLRKRRILLGAALVVPFTALSLSASGRFLDDATLWASAPEQSPRRLLFEAEEAYYEVVELWDDGRRDEARVRVARALTLAHAGNDQWRRLMGVDGPSRLRQCVQIADLHRRMGRRRQTFHYLREAEDIQPDFPGFHRTIAFLLEDLGETELALLALKRARELGFGTILDQPIGEILIRIANQYWDNTRYGRAVSALEESLDEWPEDLGNVTAGPVLMRLREERDLVLRVPDPAEDDLQGWLRLAIRLGQWGEHSRAIEILERLRRASPRDPQILFALARWGFEERGDIETAGKLYVVGLRLEPENQKVRHGIVRCMVLDRDPAFARNPSLRLKLLRGLPDAPLVLVERALAHRQLGQEAKARGLLNAAALGRGQGVIDALHMLREEDLGEE